MMSMVLQEVVIGHGSNIHDKVVPILSAVPIVLSLEDIQKPDIDKDVEKERLGRSGRKACIELLIRFLDAQGPRQKEYLIDKQKFADYYNETMGTKKLPRDLNKWIREAQLFIEGEHMVIHPLDRE